MTIEASGTGTVLDLTSFTTLDGAPTYNELLVDAYYGGEVNLSKVTSQPTGRVEFYAYGAGSVVDISALAEVSSDTSYNSSLEAGSGGTIRDPALTTLNHADLHLDDSMSSLDTSRITTITSSNLYVAGGGDLAFPALTSWTYPNGATIEANGTGSVLDLTSQTVLDGAPSYNELYVQAYYGGEVNLSKVTSQPTGRVEFYAYGTGSVVDISALAEVSSDTSYNSSLEAGSGGTIRDPALTTLNHADLHLDDSMSSLDTTRITTITSSSIYASGGAVVAFPALISYSNPDGSVFQADGVGTVLDLSSQTTLAGAASYNSLGVEAFDGGEVNLSNVTAYLGGRMYFDSQDTGSMILLTGLASLASDTGYNSTLEATDDGQIELDPGVVALPNVDIYVGGGGTIAGGTLQLSAGNLSGDGIIDANVTTSGTTDAETGSDGALTINGNFTQYGAGLIQFDIEGTTPLTEYPELVITGQAQLAGTFQVNTDTTPPVGTTFTPILYASHTGEFSTFYGLNYADGETYRTLYGGTSFNLTTSAADIRVYPTTNLLTSKAGDSATFTVVLATQPSANVTLGLTSSNTSEGTLSSSSLTFTTANWDVPQTITVKGKDDGQAGSVAYQINFAPASSTDANYSGLATAPVSLTNLPDEAQGLTVQSVLVSPSTGLNQGSSFTVSWDDVNTGHLPTLTAWDDQVTIVNTTTGATLTASDVTTDPNLVGELAPGASLSQQFAFTLPTGADGTGNIQVTVTANVNHTAFEQSTSQVNDDLQGYANGSDYPIAPTTLNVGGVDFALVPFGSSTASLGILQTTGSGTSFDLPVNITGAKSVSTLIDTTYGEDGDTVGTVEFKGTNGADAVFNLVEGVNVRDHNNDGYENNIAPGTPSAVFGNGQVRLDMQTFVLPSAFASAKLTDIILTSSGGDPQGNPFLAAATVATASGPSQLVLLGSGVAPDVASSSTVTVTSGSSQPGQASIALDPASDTGVKGDGKTDLKTPTFDVTVNEAGTIVVDYKGDGTTTATMTVSAAGEYTLTAPSLPDGMYTAEGPFHAHGRRGGNGVGIVHDRYAGAEVCRGHAEPARAGLHPHDRVQQGDGRHHAGCLVDPGQRARDHGLDFAHVGDRLGFDVRGGLREPIDPGRQL